MSRWSGLIILLGLAALVLFFWGCVSVSVIPTDLPLPTFPAIEFYSHDNGDSICLNGTDTNKLRQYLDELNAFESAWNRLRDTYPERVTR